MARRRHVQLDGLKQARAEEFAGALAESLHALKLSHQKLARELGVPRYTVDSWTRAESPRSPSHANLEKLCYFLEGRRNGLGRRLAAIASNGAVTAPSNGSRTPNYKRALSSSFIGREREIEITQNALREHRLVTLTGPGGIGKTRLALRVATEMLIEFTDGVTLVELADLHDPRLVPQALAIVLGVQEPRQDRLLSVIIEHLRDKTTLILLDNCEHLLTACADFARTLLDACLSLHILATSRQALNVDGENVGNVPPMNLPASSHPTLAQLFRSEATRLFIERAFLERQHVALTPQSSAAVTQICKRLDGIPLAIELAAACAAAMPVEEIATRLGERFLLLTRGGERVMSRHQTLREAIDWSYELLSDDERALFRRLAVFAGGWTGEAAVNICAGEQGRTGAAEKKSSPPPPSSPAPLPANEIRDCLTRLAAKSLVHVEERDGETRYRMLETVREYASERLFESGETETLQTRHLEFFLGFAEQIQPHLKGKDAIRNLNLIETEHDNFRAALKWALQSASADKALQLANVLWSFWDLRGYWSEGHDWLEKILARFDLGKPSAATAIAIKSMAHLSRRQGDHASAHRYYESSLAMSRQLGDKRDIGRTLIDWAGMFSDERIWGRAREMLEEGAALMREIGYMPSLAVALNNLGVLEKNRGDYNSARGYYEASLDIKRQIGDSAAIAQTLGNLGVLTRRLGEFSQAREYLEETIKITGEVGDWRLRATAKGNLALVAQAEGDFDSAKNLFLECRAAFEELGSRSELAETDYNLGNLARDRGDLDAAHAHYASSLQRYSKIGGQGSLAMVLDSIASLALAQERPERAATLFAQTDKIRAESSASLSPFEANDRQGDLDASRARLDPAAFGAAWAKGETLSLEQAILFALEGRD